MNRWFLLMLITALLYSVAFIGCGDDDDDDDDDDNDTGDDDDDDDDDDDTGADLCDWNLHDPMIVAGKQYLSENDVYEGYETFRDALNLCPDSVDARMGLALAVQLELERDLQGMIDYVINVVPSFKGGKDSDTKSFASLLQAILLNRLLPKAYELRTLVQVLQEDVSGNWSFYIEEYPFVVEEEPEYTNMIDMGGEWDHADLVIMEAEARFYEGLCYFLGAYDLTFDWYWTENMPDLSGLDPLVIGDIIEAIYLLTGWFNDMIEDENYPMFFLLRGDLGMEYLTKSGIAFGHAFTLLPEGAAMMLTETDDQTDDVAGYVDENENGQWDEGETYSLPYIGAMSTDQNLMWLGMLSASQSIGESIWDGSEYDVDPDNPNEILLEEFNFLLEMLGMEPLIPPLIGFNLGPYFNDPDPVQLKELIRSIVRFLNGATAPDSMDEAGKGVQQ